jgi:hypothetical protein
MMLSFERTLRAFADAAVKQSLPAGGARNVETISDFLLSVHARMPDYLRLPFRILILLFDAWAYPRWGRPFHRLLLAERVAQIEAWQKSRLEFRRRLMEFYGSLAAFALYSELYGQDYEYNAHDPGA